MGEILELRIPKIKTTQVLQNRANQKNDNTVAAPQSNNLRNKKPCLKFKICFQIKT